MRNAFFVNLINRPIAWFVKKQRIFTYYFIQQQQLNAPPPPIENGYYTITVDPSYIQYNTPLGDLSVKINVTIKRFNGYSLPITITCPDISSNWDSLGIAVNDDPMQYWRPDVMPVQIIDAQDNFSVSFGGTSSGWNGGFGWLDCGAVFTGNDGVGDPVLSNPIITAPGFSIVVTPLQQDANLTEIPIIFTGTITRDDGFSIGNPITVFAILLDTFSGELYVKGWLPEADHTLLDGSMPGLARSGIYMRTGIAYSSTFEIDWQGNSQSLDPGWPRPGDVRNNGTLIAVDSLGFRVVYMRPINNGQNVELYGVGLAAISPGGITVDGEVIIFDYAPTYDDTDIHNLAELVLLLEIPVHLQDGGFRFTLKASGRTCHTEIYNPNGSHKFSIVDGVGAYSFSNPTIINLLD